MDIAFCFLTIDNIETEIFYERFFREAYNYNIYINSKNNNKKSIFKKYVLNPSYKTKNKTDISIIYAIHYLLYNAYKNNKNKIFIILCGTNIPIINYNELYKTIINIDRPVIKTFENNKKNRYYKSDNELKKILKYNEFTKQHPNMILTREIVKKLLNNMKYIKLFKNIECSDEHYFINVLKILKEKYYDHQIIYCNPYINRTQAITFKIINNNLIKKIKENKYLFIRKINRNTKYNNEIFEILKY